MQPLLTAATATALLAVLSLAALAEEDAGVLVPGTGIKIKKVGDDFEDPAWKFKHNLPKSSYNLDGQQRQPAAVSIGGRWFEGTDRGHPDVVKRVPTPTGGLPGSQGALLLQSRDTGVPGKPSGQMRRDDFLADCVDRLGGKISTSRRPSVVVRVFFPPVEEWEARSGCTFAFGASVETDVWKYQQVPGLFGSSTERYLGEEVYHPAMLLIFESKADSGKPHDYAYFRVRANDEGDDFRSIPVTQTGWWTLGMSFSPDGRVHYFAKPGVENLTADDRFATTRPYGYQCKRFRTFFFSICSGDNGKTWSTPWIIDDPTVYYAPDGYVRPPEATVSDAPGQVPGRLDKQQTKARPVKPVPADSAMQDAPPAPPKQLFPPRPDPNIHQFVRGPTKEFSLRR